MPSGSKDRGKKELYIEVLRIIACFLVLYNHRPAYTAYMNAGSEAASWVYMILAMITRVNVPLFLMISGALLLEKQESLSIILRKRFLRILCALLLATGVLYLLTVSPGSVCISDYLTVVYGEKSDVSYWFLYTYLGMLLMLPFLRAARYALDKETVSFLFILHIVFSAVFPGIKYISGLLTGQGIAAGPHFTAAFAAERGIFYPLIGYWLARKTEVKMTGKRTAFWVAAAAAGILVSCLFTWHQGITTGKFSQDFVMMFDSLTASAVFLAVRSFFAGMSGRKKAARAATVSGSLTFGIYLLDPILRNVFGEGFDRVSAPVRPRLASSVLWCFISMAAGGVITLLMKRIPGLRKIL